MSPTYPPLKEPKRNRQKVEIKRVIMIGLKQREKAKESMKGGSPASNFERGMRRKK